MTNKIRIKNLFILLALPVGLVIFLINTSPESIPAGLLFVPFVWIFSCVFLASLHLLSSLGLVKASWSKPKIYSVSLFFALVPTGLLLLNSIGQLTSRDTIIMVLFIFLALFYVSKVNFKKHL